MTVDIAPVQRTGSFKTDESPDPNKNLPSRADKGALAAFEGNDSSGSGGGGGGAGNSLLKLGLDDAEGLDDRTPLPEEPAIPPPNRAVRTDTGSSVGRVQRALLDSFADFTPDNIDAMRDLAKAYKAAKLRELDMLQVDKDALSVDLQDTLVTIADARHAAFHALLSVRKDKQFAQGVLEKYRALVTAFEGQRMVAEREDRGQISQLRKSLADLNEQLRYAQTLGLMMNGLEKASAEAEDLHGALRSHRLDPAAITAAKPHTLAANKAALFGALEGLEARLMGARSQSLRRLASLRGGEDGGSVSSELAWLEEQLSAAQKAREGMGEDAPPPQQGLGGADDVRMRIKDVEAKLAALREGGAGREVGGARPVTAGSDGRDVQRQMAKMQERLEMELAGLRARLGVAEAQEGGGEMDREGLETQIRVLEEALAAQDEGGGRGGGQSKRQMLSQLEELEAALEGKERDSKASLASALRAAERAASHLIQLSREGATGAGVAQDIARIEATLNRSLIAAVDAQQAGLSLSSEINLRLSAAGEDVASVREVYEKAMAARGGAPDDEEWLREDLAAAQKEQEGLDAWAKEAEKELFEVEVQVREKIEGLEGVEEPEDDVTVEHTFRAKLAAQQSDDWTPYEGLVFSAADGAEYAMLWGMTESETHLLWIASAALQSPLPPGWRVCLDKMKQAFYWDYGSRTSTYHHPNDVRYKEVFEEMQAYSRSVQMVKLPPLAVEAEQKRLQEAAAVLEKHQRALKRRKERLSERHEKIAKEASEEEARRKKLEDASQAERLSLDVEKMKRVAKQDGVAAKEALREEVREEIVRVEGASIHQQILEEEKQRIVLEGVKLREEMVREEEELVMRRMEERSPEEMRSMREGIRAEQREHLKAVERDKMELEIAASRPPHVSARQREKEERLRELAAFKASAQAIDERNRAEVEEYAVYLGMDPAKDGDILWVADMALSAPLPEGWSEHQDASGNIFFYHAKSQASTYEHPMDNTFRQYIAKIRRAAR